MTKENIENFIKLCKAFELNPPAAQISKKMTDDFATHGIFAELLPKPEIKRIREMLSTLSNDPELYELRRRQCAVMLICMSDTRKRYIEKVKSAPKENLQIEFVCVNCGNVHIAVNKPETCACDVPKYIKNIL
jgi:rubrerythrin